MPAAAGVVMTTLSQFVTTLPPEARAVVDDFARKLAPLSWPDRTLAFEALWNDVVLSPRGDNPAAPVWQAIATGALARLRLRRIKHLDAAAWALLTFDPSWRQSAEDFLRKNAPAFVTWSEAHPLHDVIAEAIDQDARRTPPASVH
jgi:hypothetical protein